MQSTWLWTTGVCSGQPGRCVARRSVKSVLSNRESEGSKSLSPGSSVPACLGPCWNTISELKISDAAGTVQVRGVAATAYLIR